MIREFRVGVSAGFAAEAKGLLEPAMEAVFGPYPFIKHGFVPPTRVIEPRHIRDLDAMITLRPRFEASSFEGVDRLAAVARWGVGYDMIDVAACTQADVLLAITTDAVRKPVAEAIVTLMLALAKQLPAKDRLVREGGWARKGQITSYSLEGKTAGSIGLGNIGREMFRLLKPFQLGRFLAHDPYIPPVDAAALRVELVDLATVFCESDFVVINCPLNDMTRGMIDATCFSLMKPSAFLINTARGAIVRQNDLIAALAAGQIAGAGLDVFEQEPLPPDNPLTRMDNVILAPHALAWTDNLYRDNGLGACRNVLSVLRGEAPKHMVNQDVTARPGFRAKLSSLRERWAALSVNYASHEASRREIRRG